MSEAMPYFLLGFVVFQQFFFLWHIQRLVDKVMSRNYHEYVKATEAPAPRVMVASDLPSEDLNALHGIG